MFAGPLLSYVLNHYPKVSLHLSTASPDLQLAGLRERVLDALLVHSRAVRPDDDLDINLIGTVRSGFMSRRGHPLSRRQKISFDEIVNYPVVSTMLSDEATRTLVQQFGPPAHATRLLRASADSVAALIDVVNSTNAIFFGAMGAARAWLENEELVLLNLDKPLEIDAPYAFVTLAGRTQSPVLEKIREFCMQLVAQKIKIAKK
jgi:DNA-binding transcriptional LysR family regulator